MDQSVFVIASTVAKSCQTTRLGWTGELRAVGDVLRDQLIHMRQCDFDSFAVREDKSAEDALKGLAAVSVVGRCSAGANP
jgi:uncharacterized protein (DUF934 family)